MVAAGAESPTPRFTRKGLATRQRIVDCATDLVIAHGVARTSIEDVRRVAQVSGSQMGRYFTDKRELIGEVVDRAAERVMEGQQPYLDHLDSLEAIESWVALEVDYQRSADCPGCPLGSLAVEFADADPVLARRVAEHMDAWAVRIGDGLKGMQARGQLKADAAPSRMATALLTGLQGGLLMAELTGDVAALEAVMEPLIDGVRGQMTRT